MNVSIGGYKIGNVNWFKEHEGMDAFQCDIYKNNKKIGRFSESYMNGPDEYFFNNEYELELNELRKTAEIFFDKFSSDNENSNYLEQEDFFIRFLLKLNEACYETEDNQELHISANYPYDYEIKKSKDLIDSFVKENKLVIPNIFVAMNFDLGSDEDHDYGII